MISKVKEQLGPLKASHALDTISSGGNWIPLAQMVAAPGGQVSVVSGANNYDGDVPIGVEVKCTYVGTAHYGAYKPGMPKQPADKDSVRSDVAFAFVFLRYLSRILAAGEFEGHPVEVIPGGLNGVEEGLQRLRNGEAKGTKFVIESSRRVGCEALLCGPVNFNCPRP